MATQFKRATRAQAKLRMALVGPSGAGKTYSSLALATHLVPGGRVAVIDTERGSASKYAGIFEFDVIEPDSFHPQVYISAIKLADAEGYDVLVIDSLSHAWMGKDGALEQVDNAAKRSKSANSFAAWRDVTPLHNALVDAILGARLHVIVTMRSKTEYVLEDDPRTGKKVPRKIGTQPVQRDGLEYEFDVVGDIDHDQNLVIGKTRCPALNGAVIQRPGETLATTLREWLSDGAAAPAPAPETASEAALNSLAEMMMLAAITDDERDQIRARMLDMTMEEARAEYRRLKRLVPTKATN